MMKRALIVGIVLAFLSSSALSVSSQSSSSTVHKEQFVQLLARTNLLLDHAVTSAMSGESRLAAAQQSAALQRLAHRLGEQVLNEDIARRRRGGGPDRTLVLVAQGSVAIDFMLTAIMNFLDTVDPDFLDLALKGRSLAKSIRDLM